MLFALIGLYRKGAEDHLLEIADDVNAFLGQILLPPRLAAVFRGKDGKKIGNLVIVDAADLKDAKSQLDDSPARRAGLYDRFEIAELQIEVGGIAP